MLEKQLNSADEIQAEANRLIHQSEVVLKDNVEIRVSAPTRLARIPVDLTTCSGIG